MWNYVTQFARMIGHIKPNTKKYFISFYCFIALYFNARWKIGLLTPFMLKVEDLNLIWKNSSKIP